VAWVGEMGVAWRVLARKPKGKVPLGRPDCRWKSDVNGSLIMRSVLWTVVDWQLHNPGMPSCFCQDVVRIYLCVS
jgi:hypothetical protein